MAVPVLKERTSCADTNDGLGWEAGLCLKVGPSEDASVVGLRTNRPELLPTLRSYFPQAWQQVEQDAVDFLYSYRAGGEGPRRGVRNYHIYYFGWTRMARTMDEAEALEGFHNLVYGHILNQSKLGETLLYFPALLLAGEGRLVAVVGRSWKLKNSTSTYQGLRPLHCPYVMLDQEGRFTESGFQLVGNSGPVTDLVFPSDQGEEKVSRAVGALKLFARADGFQDRAARLQALARFTEGTRIHVVPADDEALATLRL